MTWMMIAAAAVTIATPVAAQTYDQSVSAANHDSRARSDDRVAVADGANARSQEAYAQDMAIYRAQRRIAAADARLYLRQERAYADAMAVWRVQVEDCRRGRRAACNAPSPNPADFE